MYESNATDTHADMSMPCTVDAVGTVAGMYRGAVHGDDRRAAIDVEFPSVEQAASFAGTVRAYGWHADIRAGDSVVTLASVCVLTVRPIG